MTDPMLGLDYRTSHLHKGADYDREMAADPFDRYMTAQETAILERLIPKLFGAGRPRYLDFACGTGRILKAVRPMVGEAYGVDVSASMLRQAREQVPGVEWHEIDLTTGDSPVAPVDLVTSFRFFGNAQPQLRSDVLAALGRQLKPGGLLIFNAHRNPKSVGSVLRRLRGLETPETMPHGPMRDLLTRHGFRVRRVIGIGGWIVASRLAQRQLLESRAARWLEGLSRVLIPASLCPDAIFVTQKVSQ